MSVCRRNRVRVFCLQVREAACRGHEHKCTCTDASHKQRNTHAQTHTFFMTLPTAISKSSCVTCMSYHTHTHTQTKKRTHTRTFFMTLPTAISKSSCVTCMRRSLSANMPASVQQAFNSAPVAPAQTQQRRTTIHYPFASSLSSSKHAMIWRATHIHLQQRAESMMQSSATEWTDCHLKQAFPC